MKYLSVEIPEEKPRIVKFIQDDIIGIAYVNIALKNFEPKEVFSWHLSIMFEIEDTIENGMPSIKERAIIDKFKEILNAKIIDINKNKPNGIFLARISWNKTMELIWRIHDPKLVNDYLQNIASIDFSSRAYDFRIDYDLKWQLTNWHLKD